MYNPANDPWRLHYHLMPKMGWMNDPNGAVQFGGTYHIYHQYVPENPNGGATHWGHKTSSDLVYFNEEEIYLSPDKNFDMDGVYSGSAFEKDGLLHFFYTGNVKHEGDHDYTFSGREQNTVHVVSSDGFDVLKREVVIPHTAYPADFTDHIRDPKVFEHQGAYYMILGGRKRNNTGAILLYKSTDLEEWIYRGNLLEGSIDQGFMFECPDIFEIDGKTILVFSPQGIPEEEHRFLNPYSAGYLVGEIDWELEKFIPQSDFQLLDNGFDFYASQTFEDESGRRILWGWMGIGDTSPEYSYPTKARGWQHALTMPRELTVKDGHIYQQPVEAYQNIRTDEQNFVDIQEIQDLEIDVSTFELEISFSETPKAFELKLRQDTTLTYSEGLLTLSHGESGYGRRRRFVETDQLEKLQIYSDTSSLEIFVNKGEAVMSSRIFPNQEKSLQLSVDKAVDVNIWNLEL